MRAALIEAYRRVTSSLWFTPSLYVFGGMVLVFAVHHFGRQLPDTTLAFFPASNPDTVRSVLQLLASSTITVATVTFSILMVVLTMTASNFSPRALAGFMRDGVNQHTLGIFLGSFSFGITGLFITTMDKPNEYFLGMILVTATSVGFVTIGALVYFIHHTAKSVQITNLVVRLHRDAHRSLSAFLKLDKDAEETDAPVALPREAPGVVPSRCAGYIQVLDTRRLLELAVENDLVIHANRHGGAFAPHGISLCEVWPAARLTDELADALRRAYAIGSQRTAEMDPLLGIELLAEIAVRALSPAINDPNTAVNCLHYIGDLLVTVSRHELPNRVLRDEGNLRVVVAVPSFADFVERPLLAIGSAGPGHLLVVLTALGILRDLASVTRDKARLRTIRQTARALADLALKELVFERAREQVREAMDGLDPKPS